MASGDGVTFTTVSRADRRPVGGTSFLNIDRQHRRLEIGGTWLAPEWQRTACNTEAKYLQMRHAEDARVRPLVEADELADLLDVRRHYAGFRATIEYISGTLGTSGGSTQRRSASLIMHLNGWMPPRW